MRSYKDFIKVYPISAKKFAMKYKGGLTARINEVEIMPCDSKGKEELCMRLDKDDLVIQMNKTRILEIVKLHGEDLDKWSGKQIHLYTVDGEFEGEACKELHCRKAK